MQIKEITLSHAHSYSLLIIAGVHGNEQLAVKLISELQQTFHNAYNNNAFSESERNMLQFIGEQVRKITIVNMVNETGIRADTREWQDVDNTTMDLNRAFNVKQNPEYTDTVETLKRLISNHDMVIDVHNSPDCADMILLDADDYAESLRKMYSSFGFKNCFYWAGTKSTIKSYGNMARPYKAITVEIGGMGQTDINTCLKHKYNLIEIIYKFIQVYMACRGNNTEKSGEVLYETIPPFNKMRSIVSHVDGILTYSRYGNHDYQYHQGEIICSIKDTNGKILEYVHSPVTGRVISYITNCYVTRGMELGLVWED